MMMMMRRRRRRTTILMTNYFTMCVGGGKLGDTWASEGAMFYVECLSA
jgi:hypothetical protein